MRKVTNINADWIFVDPKTQKAENVTLPHTWNALDGQDGGGDYYRGEAVYFHSFSCPEMKEGERLYVEFKGVNSSCRVILNEQEVGKHDGGYSTFRIDLTSGLKKENVLKVLVDNRENDRVYPQKADFTFYGGIYRDVNLIQVPKDHFDLDYFGSKGLKVDATPKDGKGEVTVHAFTKSDKKVEITIQDQEGNKVLSLKNDETGTIDNVHLWDGRKDPYLYIAIARLLDEDGSVLDAVSTRFGFRTFSFDSKRGFFLNGRPYPLHGVSRHQDRLGKGNAISREDHIQDMELIEEVGANTIRLAHYQHDDFFYDLCDELGLVVWEDFMFACSVYELTPEFEDNITREFIDNIKRLRHHASLGLWCGNNEMESFVKDGEWVSKPSEVRDYLFMYERIIPKVLRKYDPVTFYWPSSPSSGGSFDEPQDPNRGDVHFWQVWHGNKPFSEYRKYGFRYLSEFGFQAFPSVKTVEEGISDDPQDWNIFSYVMEKHQRNNAANGKIINYLQQTYKYPYDFSSLVYASQLLQADGIRYGVEHFRRNRGRCMGAVYWQLNDCWPVTSWSSIDYYGRWKALHYYAKRFFAPVMISCEEQNWMTASADMNRQHFVFEKSIRLNVANETMEEKHLTVRWALRKADASVIREESQEITVAPLSAYWLDKVLLPDADLFDEYVSYQVEEKGEILSYGTVIFSYPKYFRYVDPHLQVEVDGDELIIKASGYAKSVEILNEEEDLILEDNYFDMNGGERRVKILRGKPVGLKVRSVYNIGRN